MRANALDTVALVGQSNVVYATGARAPAADASLAAHQRMAAVVDAGDEWPHLYTAFPDGVPDELPADHVHEALPLETEAGAKALAARLPQRKFALDEYTYPLYRVLAGREPQDATPTMSAAKIVKTVDEIELIRAAQRINEEAMLDVESMLAPGVRATELSGRFLRRIFELGATANTVDPIFQRMPEAVDAGPFTLTGDLVFPTVTRDLRLERGDVIWVDTGINFHGYASDFGRTWIVGQDPDARQQAQFEAWRATIERVTAAIRPGATAADLVEAAGEVYGRRPWPSHLYLGHGIGTDSAEMPLVGTDLGPAFDASLILAAGMIVVLEPIAWEDGHGGYRAEEIVVVTDGGCEFITRHHYWPFS
ncbi:MAG: aminopeptidase P family protein [Actinobacteria bacterium]|nr:aminopeptidase P family protein [Actinomycetota bacterium]